MSCKVCEREAIDCFECANKAGRESTETPHETKKQRNHLHEFWAARDRQALKASHFLQLLEKNYQRWCDDGDTEGYRNRNGLLWDAIAKAGSEVFCLVNQGLDRGE